MSRWLRCWRLGGALIVLAACGVNGGTTSTAAAEHVVGGDILFEMQPGALLAETAEQDAGHIAERMNMTLIPGTADYVAQSDREADHMIFPESASVLTFRALGPRGGDPELCVSFGGTAECGIDLDEPRLWTGVVVAASTPTAAAYGSAGDAEAVVTTESGKTVSVMSQRGWAYAAWPTEWGQPLAVTFYDASGNLVVSLDY